MVVHGPPRVPWQRNYCAYFDIARNLAPYRIRAHSAGIMIIDNPARSDEAGPIPRLRKNDLPKSGKAAATELLKKSFPARILATY